MDAKGAVSLLQDVGIGRIADFDGCLCSAMEIKGVHIDVACRKSGASGDFCGMLVRVYSNHMDVLPDDLRVVALEVTRQLRKLDSWSPLAVRYCSYMIDRECKCVYCEKPRQSLTGYLCHVCQNGSDPFGDSIAERRDYTRAAFEPPPPVDDNA